MREFSWLVHLSSAIYRAPPLFWWSSSRSWLTWSIRPCIVLSNMHCTSKLSVSAMSTFTTAKSLQSCLTLCDPIDSSPPGSPVPGILQARTLEWIAISFSNVWKWKVKVKLLSQLSTSILFMEVDWMHWCETCRYGKPTELYNFIKWTWASVGFGIH